MRLQKRRFRNQSGFFSAKASLVTGVIITAAIGGAATYSSLSNSVISKSLVTIGSGVCITAVWEEKPDIKTQKGDCGSDGIIVPPDEVDNTAVVSTYSCGPAKVEITQAMQDHSDANLELKNAGKENEMTPWSNGGWNIILPVNEYYPSINGVVFTTKGEFDLASFNNIHHSSGLALIFTSGDMCRAFNIVNAVNHSDNTPAFYQKHNEVLTMIYMKNGLQHRDGDLPAALETTSDETTGLSYYKEGVPHKIGAPAIYAKNDGNGSALEEWFVNGVHHRIDGPAAYRRNNTDGSIEMLHFKINDVEMNTKEEWMAAGGVPEAWFTKLDYPDGENSPKVWSPK